MLFLPEKNVHNRETMEVLAYSCRNSTEVKGYFNFFNKHFSKFVIYQTVFRTTITTNRKIHGTCSEKDCGSTYIKKVNNNMQFL